MIHSWMCSVSQQRGRLEYRCRRSVIYLWCCVSFRCLNRAKTDEHGNFKPRLPISRTLRFM